jgi:LacI family transcriptional regulator
MSKTVNIREIAKAAGVSIASVSRALQSTPSRYLSEKQRQKILDVCAQMHYQPNEHTRRMLSRRANTVAILFPPSLLVNADYQSHNMDNNFGECMMGVQSVLVEHGIGLLLGEVSKIFLDERKHLKMSQSKAIDGVLAWGVMVDDVYPQEILQENIPLVMLQNELSSCRCNKVIADNYTGTSAVAEQILQAGHRKIAVAGAPMTSSSGRERYWRIVETLQKYGIKPVFKTVEQGYGYLFGCRATEEIRQSGKEFTAIIASNDLAAWGCIETLAKYGMKVPEDISTGGADGLHFPGSMRVSSFYLPAYEIGRIGAELLLGQLNGDRQIHHCCLPVNQIPGETIKNIKNKEQG